MPKHWADEFCHGTMDERAGDEEFFGMVLLTVEPLRPRAAEDDLLMSSMHTVFGFNSQFLKAFAELLQHHPNPFCRPKHIVETPEEAAMLLTTSKFTPRVGDTIDTPHRVREAMSRYEAWLDKQKKLTSKTK